MGEDVRHEEEPDSRQRFAKIFRAERLRQNLDAGKSRLRLIGHSSTAHLIAICTSGVMPACHGDQRTITSVYVPLAAIV